MTAIICLLSGAACGGKGSGGSSGAGGRGGSGGAGTGAGGGGGAGGGYDGIVIGGCPPSRPAIGTPCIGTFSCNYDDTCRCGTCCFSTFRCTSGGIEFLGNNDGCLQIRCDPPVCTFGADQTCNDSPVISSIHGHCTDAGTCDCTFDAGTNPDSGRCL